MALRKAWLALQLTSPYVQEGFKFTLVERFNPELLTSNGDTVHQRAREQLVVMPWKNNQESIDKSITRVMFRSTKVVRNEALKMPVRTIHSKWKEARGLQGDDIARPETFLLASLRFIRSESSWKTNQNILQQYSCFVCQPVAWHISFSVFGIKCWSSWNTSEKFE